MIVMSLKQLDIAGSHSSTLSPKMEFLIFAVLVAIVFIFLLDLIGIHLPYNSKYLFMAIAFVLYAFLAKIKEKMRHNETTTTNQNSDEI